MAAKCGVIPQQMVVSEDSLCCINGVECWKLISTMKRVYTHPRRGQCTDLDEQAGQFQG